MSLEHSMRNPVRELRLRGPDRIVKLSSGWVRGTMPMRSCVLINPITRDTGPPNTRSRQSSCNSTLLAGIRSKKPTDSVIGHPYLNNTTTWGINKLHALRQLFTTGPWLSPACTPS
jgi:hypothetical protein